MATISSTIEIAAPPAKVREVFLNFAQLSTYHSSFIQHVTPLSPTGSLEPGEKLDCEIMGSPFEVVITLNTPSAFQWRGPPVQAVTGLHGFYFEPSTEHPGGTTFVQSERLSGLLAFLVQPWLMGRELQRGFVAFGEDLKGACERA